MTRRHTVVTYFRHIYATWDLNTQGELAGRYKKLARGLPNS
jgi:hypothetical protein